MWFHICPDVIAKTTHCVGDGGKENIEGHWRWECEWIICVENTLLLELKQRELFLLKRFDIKIYEINPFNLFPEQFHLTYTLACVSGYLWRSMCLTLPECVVCASDTSAAMAHPVLLYMNSRLFLLRYSRPPTRDTNKAKAIVPE